jgi:hypothetical protein
MHSKSYGGEPRFHGQVIVISGQPEPIRIEATSLGRANGFKEPAPVQLAQLRDLLAVVRADTLARAWPIMVTS